MTTLFGLALQPSDVLALCAIPVLVYAIILHWQIKRDAREDAGADGLAHPAE